MNYELFEDSDSINPVFIASFERPAEFRPHVGDKIQVNNNIKIFLINRSDPTDNPDDQKVLYFAREFRDNSRSQFNIITQTLPVNVP